MTDLRSRPQQVPTTRDPTVRDPRMRDPRMRDPVRLGDGTDQDPRARALLDDSLATVRVEQILHLPDRRRPARG